MHVISRADLEGRGRRAPPLKPLVYMVGEYSTIVLQKSSIMQIRILINYFLLLANFARVKMPNALTFLFHTERIACNVKGGFRGAKQACATTEFTHVYCWRMQHRNIAETFFKLIRILINDGCCWRIIMDASKHEYI